MPKITLTERQKDRERLAHNLQLLQRSRSYTCEDMGKIIGKSAPTYLSRLRNPDNLTFGEISSLHCADTSRLSLSGSSAALWGVM